MSLQSIIDSLNYTKNSVDVVSYVATDKTTTDHALSYFFNNVTKWFISHIKILNNFKIL